MNYLTRNINSNCLIILLSIVLFISCNKSTDSNPENFYMIKCPDGFLDTCNIEGDYYETNPLYYPNDFSIAQWNIKHEYIESPYYNTISQISSDCRKIILRGLNGQVQREIPIIGFNDTMLTISDTMVRPDDIVLVRTVNDYFRGYYCSNICSNGCLDKGQYTREICKCDEFKHGNNCSLSASLIDFTTDDDIDDIYVNNNNLLIHSSKKHLSEISEINLSSINENGTVEWNLQYPNEMYSSYIGTYEGSDNLVSYYEEKSGSNIIIHYHNVAKSGQNINLDTCYSNNSSGFKLVFSLQSNDNFYIFGTYDFIVPFYKNLVVLKFDSHGKQIAYKYLNDSDIYTQSNFRGGYDSFNDQISLFIGNNLFNISTSTLEIIDKLSISNGTPNQTVTKNKIWLNTKFALYNGSTNLYGSPPDNVVIYLNNYKIFNTDYTVNNIIWTPYLLMNRFPSSNIFEDNSGKYFFYGLGQESYLRFGKYNEKLNSLVYIYTFVYNTDILNVYPRQLSNGNYIFACNTKRFGTNNDILLINFNESGLYNYECQ
jgi:hypothetical protein